MIYSDVPLGQYFFKITVRNGIADVEEHRVQDYGLRIVHALEIDHANRLLPTPWQGSHFHEQPDSRNFATQPDRALLLVAFASGGRRRNEVASLRIGQLIKQDPVSADPKDPEALAEWLERARIAESAVFHCLKRCSNHSTSRLHRLHATITMPNINSAVPQS